MKTRKHLVLRTETSRDAEEFIDFFRNLKGKSLEVIDVGLSQLSPKVTRTVQLFLKAKEDT